MCLKLGKNCYHEYQGHSRLELFPLDRVSTTVSGTRPPTVFLGGYVRLVPERGRYASPARHIRRL